MSRKRKPATPMVAPQNTTPSVPPSADGDVSAQEKVAAVVDAPKGPEALSVLQGAWDVLQVAAQALSEESLVQPTVSIRDAALLGLRVATELTADPSAMSDFASLGATRFFDVRHVHTLATAARAVLYVRAHVDADVPVTTSVSQELIGEAKALQGRMLKVLGFYFDEGSDVGRELAKVRGAKGHAGLAGSLLTLGTLYGAHQKRIEKTPEFYRATDARAAGAVAEKIYAELAAPDATGTWSDRQARAWTLFATAYSEVCAAGRFMYRHAKDLDARFPSLHSVNAARRGPAKKSEDPPTPADPK
jgi:hypothetical protein